MLSYKAKNYALLTKDGDVIIKGGALKSRGLEKFQRVFLEEMIKMIMQGKSEAIADLRNEFERKIRNREWKIDMLMKTDTLQDSLDKYRAKIAGSARNRAAAYELALASGRNYRPGDQISYYIKATPKRFLLTKLPNLLAISIRKPRRKCRLLRREARRFGEEIQRPHQCGIQLRSRRAWRFSRITSAVLEQFSEPRRECQSKLNENTPGSASNSSRSFRANATFEIECRRKTANTEA